jgi:hypothetical protein
MVVEGLGYASYLDLTVLDGGSLTALLSTLDGPTRVIRVSGGIFAARSSSLRGMLAVSGGGSASLNACGCRPPMAKLNSDKRSEECA